MFSIINGIPEKNTQKLEKVPQSCQLMKLTTFKEVTLDNVE